MSKLDQWSKNPRMMLDWRVSNFRKNLLRLESLINEPPPDCKMSEQLKAIELMNKMMAYLDEVRDDLPTECPKCGQVFVPAKGINEED